MRMLLPIGLGLCACLSGCSGLVREFVDTQPRVEMTESDFDDPGRIVKGEAVVYEPFQRPEDDASIDPDILRNAPAIVQGVPEQSGSSPKYNREDDAIGSPRLSKDARSVRVDTDDPRLYTRVEHATIDGVELKQLVYAFWYPRRSVGSIETGSVDGGVLRITLDVNGQPAVFEYAQPCGCFHGVFVSEAIEAAASRQIGPPAPRRVYAVEPPLSGKSDWVVRGVVPSIPGGRVTLYMSAGKHFCQAIRYRSPSVAGGADAVTRAYAVASYDQLSHAPRDGGGEGSIFDKDGRVLGAERAAEQIILGDLDHAGWPRHLDAMLIHWDTSRWTDTTLLATKLRLPPTLIGRGDAAALTGVNASAVNPGGAPASEGLAGHGRTLLLFTNKRCAGCQHTKNVIAGSSRIQQLLREWDYRVVDTATPEGAQLAAMQRVSMVPVLVALDGDRETFRAEDIDTTEKVVAAIGRHD